MKIEILPSAMEDLDRGRRFYERKEAGLGEYFLRRLFEDIDSLGVSAGVHLIHFDEYHRLLSKRFPYAVYYTMAGRTVYVYAVMDCRRNPEWIERRLKGRRQQR